MTKWQPIETAPRDGVVFLALNIDGEVWVSKFIDDRLAFRMNQRRSPRKFTVHKIDGRELLEEDEDFARINEAWSNSWTYWSRLYDFSPTHWHPLPEPPQD